MFRDLSDTGLNPSLWGTVQQQLDGSSWFVLLACPESAASRWVAQEIDHWCATKGVDTILVVLTDGELVWDRDEGSFAAATTALAPDVAARFTSEPLHLDLRWTRELDAPPGLRDPRFKTEMARLASPIRMLAPADLESEDVRLHRAARRLARAAVAALVALALVATVAAVLAVRNAREAEQRAREATARQVGLAALDLDASQLDRALLLSLAASRLDPDAGPDRFLASRTLLGRHSRLVAMLHTPDQRDEPSLQRVAISPSGEVVATTAWPSNDDPVTVTWSGDGRSHVAPLSDPAVAHLAVRDDGTTITVPSATTLAVDATASRAVVVTADGVGLVDPVDGTTLAAWPGTGALAAITGQRAAIAIGRTVHLVDTRDGTTLASVTLTTAPTAITVRGDTVLVASSPTTLTWWEPAGDRLTAVAEAVDVSAVGPIEQLALASNARRALLVGRLGSAMVSGPEGGVSAFDPVAGAVSIDPTGRFAAVGGSRLTVWNLQLGERAIAVSEQVNAMAWSGCDGAPCRLVTVGAVLDVWEPATGRRTRLADQTNAQTVAVSEDGSTVVSAGWGATVAMWTLDVPIDDTGRTELSAAGAPTAVDAATGALARLDADDRVTVTHATTRRTINTGIDELGPVDELRLFADATRLLAVVDGELALFDVVGSRPIGLARECEGDLWALSPGGSRLVTHRWHDGRTVVCDTSNGAIVIGGEMSTSEERDGDDGEGAAPPEVVAPFTRARSAGDATAVAVDDDGSVALARGHEVAYHAVADGAFAAGEAVDVELAGETVTIESLVLRHGRLAATVEPRGDRPARVLVWDAATRGTAVQFESDHPELEAVALLGDRAELLAVAGRTATGSVVQVWEAESRRRLGLGLGGLGSTVVSLAGDVDAVIGVDAAGGAYRWSLDQDPRREVCEIVGRDLTADEWPQLADGALARYEYAPVCSAAG